MISEINHYHQVLSLEDKKICDALYLLITTSLGSNECKIWHSHPVWFIEGNPIVGYHKLKNSIRVLFWSGQSFEEEKLFPEGKFKAAEIRYTNVNQLVIPDIERWLEKSKTIQWDYKNIVKRKGVLEKLTF